MGHNRMKQFTIEKLALPGVFFVRPNVYPDNRGYAAVPFQQEEFSKFGITAHFVQDFVSYSKRDVIRGLHFQRAPYAQDKLVRCSSGEIFDVAADCDPTSETYGTHVSVLLRAEEQGMLFIPGKYAHGFCVVSDGAVTEYKMSASYEPQSAAGFRWNDPILNIPWPTSHPIVSEQDAAWPLLPSSHE